MKGVGKLFVLTNIKNLFKLISVSEVCRNGHFKCNNYDRVTTGY